MTHGTATAKNFAYSSGKPYIYQLQLSTSDKLSDNNNINRLKLYHSIRGSLIMLTTESSWTSLFFGHIRVKGMQRAVQDGHQHYRDHRGENHDAQDRVQEQEDLARRRLHAGDGPVASHHKRGVEQSIRPVEAFKGPEADTAHEQRHAVDAHRDGHALAYTCHELRQG